MVCWPFPFRGGPAGSLTLLMYILFLDESGDPALGGKGTRYFVLAGLALPVGSIPEISARLDRLTHRFLGQRSSPLHATDLSASEGGLKPPFTNLDFGTRLRLLNNVYHLISNSDATLFGIAIDTKYVNEPPYELAIEHLLARFDIFLSNISNEETSANMERGMTLVAQSAYQDNLQRHHSNLWENQNRWGGDQRNQLGVPAFAPVEGWRPLQLADFIANAVFRRYERGAQQQFDLIARKFDSVDGVMHGLVHYHETRNTCTCPACWTRNPI